MTGEPGKEYSLTLEAPIAIDATKPQAMDTCESMKPIFRITQNSCKPGEEFLKSGECER